MKKILMMLPILALSLQFFSCSTDYDGAKPANQVPVINIYDTSDITSSKKTKIQWYGNDSDGMKIKYYYTVTTDTTLTVDNVKTSLPLDGTDLDGNPYWSETENTYAYISMPFGPYHSEVVFLDTATYTDPAITDTITFKAVYSKFFVFGVDENEDNTLMQSKIFKRTNKIPKYPMVYSQKLGLNGFDKYWMTVGSDSAQMVLEEPTTFWKNFDFKWMGEDPDGADVDLEFRWELWERQRLSGVDNYITLVASSNGWSINNLSVSFDDKIYNHNKQGKYAFMVYVRDDAFEESEHHATINFEVFAPQFDKGILLIDDTDPTMYPPPTTNYLIMGNPDASLVTAFYEELLQYAGYQPDSLVAGTPDSLKGYVVKKFQKGTEFVGWDYIWDDDDDNPATPEVIVDSTAVYRGVYDPSIRDLTRYKLVVIASDDRSNIRGVDFAGEPPYTGYNQYLSQYLDVKGNVFILGNSVLMGKIYASPDQLPIHQYKEPYRYVFDTYAISGQGVSASTEDFFNKYFGIYSMTFPEQKTYYVENAPNPALVPTDYKYSENYDFVGATVYEHISAEEGLLPLKIDSARVNGAWFDRPRSTMLYRLALKDNGTVFTGVPTFEAYKGEVVYKYQSLYDLPKDATNDSLVVDGDMTHWLYWKDAVTGEKGPILRRSGSVATRFVAEGDNFRTAFFGLPTYFLDNSDDQVSEMFKAMIEWFNINNDGGAK